MILNFILLLALLVNFILMFSSHFQVKAVVFFNLFLLFICNFAIEIWETIRSDLPFGLLPFYQISNSHQEFLATILVGIICGNTFAILLWYVIKKQDPVSAKSILARSVESIIRNRNLIVTTSLLCLILLIIGEGTSLWSRSSYLETNGVVFFTKAIGPFVIPICLALIVLISSATTKIFRMTLFSIWISYFLLFYSKGSRLAIYILIASIGVWFVISKHRIFTKLLLSIVYLTTTYALLPGIFFPRLNSSGLVETYQQLSFAITNTLDDPTRYPNYFMGLLLGWVVTLPMSVGIGNGTILLNNLNPLPGVGQIVDNIGSDGIERIFPYRWIPASAYGQIYGVTGFLGLFCISLVTTVLFLVAVASQNSQAFSLLLTPLYFGQAALGLQYSSRGFFRILWTFLFFVLLERIFKSKSNFSVQKSR